MTMGRNMMMNQIHQKQQSLKNPLLSNVMPISAGSSTQDYTASQTHHNARSTLHQQQFEKKSLRLHTTAITNRMRGGTMGPQQKLLPPVSSAGQPHNGGLTSSQVIVSSPQSSVRRSDIS